MNSASRRPFSSGAVPPPQAATAEPRPSGSHCAHSRVQIVAREQDSEFVECLECREIFEGSEFRDMAIEATIDGAQDEDKDKDE